MPEPFSFMTRNGTNNGMLAGVCSRLADMLGWNIWVVRAVLLVLLVAKPLWTIIAYAAAALLFSLLDRSGRLWRGRPSRGAGPADDGQPRELRSPELAARQQRIDDLERRFSEWEQKLPDK